MLQMYPSLELPLADLIAMLEKRPPVRVPGTAIFLTSDPLSAPTALMHSLKHYKVLHERNAILTIESDPLPRVDPADRVRLEAISETFYRIVLRFGFMETPDVPQALDGHGRLSPRRAAAPGVGRRTRRRRCRTRGKKT